MGKDISEFQITAEANGRVNLIGEHTDYNGGWVLPTAIPQRTSVSILKRNDRKVAAKTQAGFPHESSELVYTLGEEKRQYSWIDYLQGCTFYIENLGYSLLGMNILVNSSVPIGSGLSSSAALLIAFLKALKQSFTLPFSDLEIAQMAQKIENGFVGAKVGIMDQMACTFARQGQALYLDTKTLEFERIDLPLSEMDLVVINSGVEHQHAGGDYNQRRAECEKACKILGIEELRSLEEDRLDCAFQLNHILFRRVRHVVTENARVHRSVDAIKKKDISRLGKIFYQSHFSMRDDYEVSIPVIDYMVDLCSENPATFGARLTGGGFGGSIVAITEKGQGYSMAKAVVEKYNERTGHHATILVPQVLMA